MIRSVIDTTSGVRQRLHEKIKKPTTTTVCLSYEWARFFGSVSFYSKIFVQMCIKFRFTTSLSNDVCKRQNGSKEKNNSFYVCQPILTFWMCWSIGVRLVLYPIKVLTNISTVSPKKKKKTWYGKNFFNLKIKTLLMYKCKPKVFIMSFKGVWEIYTKKVLIIKSFDIMS